MLRRVIIDSKYFSDKDKRKIRGNIDKIQKVKKGEMNMRTDLLEKKEQILQWISENRSKAYMAKELNCNPKTINPLLERLGIEYKGNQSGKGISKSGGK